MLDLIASAGHRSWPLWALVGTLLGALCTGTALAGDWHIPDVKTLPDDANGSLVRQGFALLQNTFEYIGSEMPDEAKRFAGT